MLPWKSNYSFIFWLCVFILRYPGCKTHASYCHLRYFRLYDIFSTLFHKRQDFRERSIEHKICLDFLYIICPKHFSFWEELSEICRMVLMWCTRYFYQILIKLVFCRQIFEEYSKTSFIKICPLRVKLLHADGQTDRKKHDETNGSFTQFCERA